MELPSCTEYQRSPRSAGKVFHQFGKGVIGPVGKELFIMKTLLDDMLGQGQSHDSIRTRLNGNPLVALSGSVGQADVERDQFGIFGHPPLDDPLGQEDVLLVILVRVRPEIQNKSGLRGITYRESRTPGQHPTEFSVMARVVTLHKDGGGTKGFQKSKGAKLF